MMPRGEVCGLHLVEELPAAEKAKQLGPVPEKVAVDKKETESKSDVKEEVDLSAMEALALLRKTKPPIRKFMDVKDAKELRIGDVEELLKDYKRLAEAVREAISS